MNILLFVPTTRHIEPFRESVRQQDFNGLRVTVEFATAGDIAGAPIHENITRKYRTGRQMALSGGCDAMWCVEDDIVLPPDALQRLLAVEADIAYALVCTRKHPHVWNADYINGPEDNDYRTYDMDPDKARGAWGRVIDVIGCGLFCTLIHRNVLEAIDFDLRGWRCCDFYHAWDAFKAGFSQKCDTRIQCGHIMNKDGPPWQVVWPDLDQRYRYEELTA